MLYFCFRIPASFPHKMGTGFFEHLLSTCGDFLLMAYLIQKIWIKYAIFLWYGSSFTVLIHTEAESNRVSSIKRWFKRPGNRRACEPGTGISIRLNKPMTEKYVSENVVREEELTEETELLTLLDHF